MLCCPHYSRLSTTLNNIVELESGVTKQNKIVNNCEHCGQPNILDINILTCFATSYNERVDTSDQKRLSIVDLYFAKIAHYYAKFSKQSD
mgnify:CR=1 FL=1